MKTVKIKTPFGGNVNGKPMSFAGGDIVDVDDDVAKTIIGWGYASIADPSESATKLNFKKSVKSAVK